MEKTLNSMQYQVLLDLLLRSRKDQQLTQQELAERIGMMQADISKVERGVRRLDILELRTWLKGLDVPLTSFVTELDQRLSSQESLARQATGRHRNRSA